MSQEASSTETTTPNQPKSPFYPDLLPAICPDIARSTAIDIADFAITSGGFKQNN